VFTFVPVGKRLVIETVAARCASFGTPPPDLLGLYLHTSPENQNTNIPTFLPLTRTVVNFSYAYWNTFVHGPIYAYTGTLSVSADRSTVGNGAGCYVALHGYLVTLVQ
jgi:hypothetical protein